MKGEDLIRIEHKLDALLWYMQELTGIPPKDIPRQIPGAGGMTNGVCPITRTPIYYHVDVNSGSVVRKDGLTSGVVSSSPISMPEVKGYSVTILNGGLGDHDGN
jgi:hypothetical protein